jgi:hypothetical protein
MRSTADVRPRRGALFDLESRSMCSTVCFPAVEDCNAIEWLSGRRVCRRQGRSFIEAIPSDGHHCLCFVNAAVSATGAQSTGPRPPAERTRARLSIETSRYPATARVLPSVRGSPIRRKDHPARRKIHSIRAPVTVTISASCSDMLVHAQISYISYRNPHCRK